MLMPVACPFVLSQLNRDPNCFQDMEAHGGPDAPQTPIQLSWWTFARCQCKSVRCSRGLSQLYAPDGADMFVSAKSVSIVATGVGVPFQKRQQYDNSCGAASLLCAAAELGVTAMPNIGSSMFLNGQPLQVTNLCESAIYQISSGMTTGPPGSQPAGMTSAGYSLPHNLAFAARLLGLRAHVFLTPGAFSTALGWLYPSCESKCRGAGVPVSARHPPLMGPRVRRLRIVGVLKFVGLHYLLERPDGSFMDPADGVDYASLDAANNGWLKSYSDTGIVLDLSRPMMTAPVMRQAVRDRKFQARHGGAHESPF